MHQYTEILTALCIVLGGTFVLIGSFGLIKLPNLLSRLHGPSKATTLGVGGCLVASMIHFGSMQGRVSTQELLITFFLFITAPVTAHFIARAYLYKETDTRAELPLAKGNSGWSTFTKLPGDNAATQIDDDEQR
jgi:multicomponent K+:H+ antiporter subunit G